MSDATLRQINGVVAKETTGDGSNVTSNLPLIEQLAGGKYYKGTSNVIVYDCLSPNWMSGLYKGENIDHIRNFKLNFVTSRFQSETTFSLSSTNL